MSVIILLQVIEYFKAPQQQPGIQRVQALADISRLGLCCHSNKTRASIANPLNSAQLGGTSYHSPNLHLGPCSSVGMWRWTDRYTDTHRQTHTDTETRVTNTHFVSSTTHAKCNNNNNKTIIDSTLCPSHYTTCCKPLTNGNALYVIITKNSTRPLTHQLIAALQSRKC